MFFIHRPTSRSCAQSRISRQYSMSSRAGSIDFSRPGGFCYSCNCITCYGECGGCDYNTEIYVVHEQRIMFGEEPGPGVCCLMSSLLFPVACLMLLCFSTCKIVNGIEFIATENSVECNVHSKTACSEEDPIFIKNVIGFELARSDHTNYRHTQHGNVSVHIVDVSFLIKYHDANGEEQVHETPQMVRTISTYREEYYQEFALEVVSFIRQHNPRASHSAGFAGSAASGIDGAQDNTGRMEPSDEGIRSALKALCGAED